MFRVKKKWFARSLIFLVVVLMALLLATTALADGPEPKGPPGPMGPPDMHNGGMMMGGMISGMVWYDGNGNMEFDPHKSNPKKGEHPMDGAVVKLWALPMMGGHYAPTKHFFASTTARDGGMYKFEGVPPGLYSIEVIPPPSHVLDKLTLKHNPTMPFQLMGGEKKYISFGFKVDLPFKDYAELNEPPRLSP